MKWWVRATAAQFEAARHGTGEFRARAVRELCATIADGDRGLILAELASSGPLPDDVLAKGDRCPSARPQADICSGSPSNTTTTV